MGLHKTEILPPTTTSNFVEEAVMYGIINEDRIDQLIGAIFTSLMAMPCLTDELGSFILNPPFVGTLSFTVGVGYFDVIG